MMRQTKIDWFVAGNNIILFLIAFIALYPIYYVAIVSISDGRAVLQGKVNLLPIGFDLSAYKKVLSDPLVLISYKNTILYTVTGTVVNIIMSMLCAYPLSRKSFMGKRLFTFMIIFTMFFSGGMIPMYLLVKNLQMIDTIWAIIIPGAISSYNMIIIRTFFQGIPEELHESAYIDGASEYQVFYNIVIPLSKTIIATMILFYAVGHWNSFLPALLYLNKRNLQPIQLILRNIVVEGSLLDLRSSSEAGGSIVISDESLKYSTIMIATLPILVVYPFIQKYFIKGVMIGSLKG